MKSQNTIFLKTQNLITFHMRTKSDNRSNLRERLRSQQKWLTTNYYKSESICAICCKILNQSNVSVVTL